jgi:hypothetical protein
MPVPLRGDFRMDPATRNGARPSGKVSSAFKTTSGILLALLLVAALLMGAAALFLLPA